MAEDKPPEEKEQESQDEAHQRSAPSGKVVYKGDPE
jgi:hypothetical protein